MDFGLSEDQREIQRTARELLSERASPARVREHAEARRCDEELWRELSELGWPGIALPEAHGGQGLGMVELGILCEELGRSIAPVPFLPSVIAAAVIERAGSEEQRERLLPDLARGEARGALGIVGAVNDGVAMDGLAATDGGAGMDDGAAAGGDAGTAGGVAAAGGAARERSDAPAGRVAEFVVGAADAQVLVLVDEGSPGEPPTARVLTPAQAEVTPLDAIDPTRSAARVSAPAEAGEALPGDVAAGVDRALVAVASELVGVCGRALETTVAYVKERRQFGVPVGAFQAVSHRCAQMLLDTERARATAAFAAWTADADPERLPEAAAMAKAGAAEAGREVTAGAIQAHGGIGFTWEADLHWLYKRAQLDAALLGGAARHRARLAAILAARA
jgi:alkylation response protein AidB-like acyl-CoA dehydrogenase